MTPEPFPKFFTAKIGTGAFFELRGSGAGARFFGRSEARSGAEDFFGVGAGATFVAAPQPCLFRLDTRNLKFEKNTEIILIRTLVVPIY